MQTEQSQTLKQKAKPDINQYTSVRIMLGLGTLLCPNYAAQLIVINNYCTEATCNVVSSYIYLQVSHFSFPLAFIIQECAVDNKG